MTNQVLPFAGVVLVLFVFAFAAGRARRRAGIVTPGSRPACCGWRCCSACSWSSSGRSRSKRRRRARRAARRRGRAGRHLPRQGGGARRPTPRAGGRAARRHRRPLRHPPASGGDRAVGRRRSSPRPAGWPPSVRSTAGSPLACEGSGDAAPAPAAPGGGARPHRCHPGLRSSVRDRRGGGLRRLALVRLAGGVRSNVRCGGTVAFGPLLDE